MKTRRAKITPCLAALMSLESYIWRQELGKEGENHGKLYDYNILPREFPQRCSAEQNESKPGVAELGIRNKWYW